MCVGGSPALLGRLGERLLCGSLCLQTISTLKGRLSELQWSAMNQEMQVKRLESEKQELKEQLDLQHK